MSTISVPTVGEGLPAGFVPVVVLEVPQLRARTAMAAMQRKGGRLTADHLASHRLTFNIQIEHTPASDRLAGLEIVDWQSGCLSPRSGCRPSRMAVRPENVAISYSPTGGTERRGRELNSRWASDQ